MKLIAKEEWELEKFRFYFASLSAPNYQKEFFDKLAVDDFVTADALKNFMLKNGSKNVSINIAKVIIEQFD